jgi:hypothetical protein
MPCDCGDNNFTNTQCTSCSGGSNNTISTQKQIWKQVRVPASLYSMNLAALNMASERLTNATLAKPTNWNQSSDSWVASQQTAYHPTHGNSLKSTLTSLRPGAGAPAGTGVDIKHNSYARYLGRKKAINIRTQSKATAATNPIQGNKTQSYGLINQSQDCICKT